MSLVEARDKAFENRRLARSGGNPLAAKRKAQMPTFRQAAERTWEANRPRWRNAKVATNWMQQLERHAFQGLGELPVDQIGREDVLAVLVPIWTSKPETARRVRRHIRATLRWCQAHGHVEQNVAGEAIDGALPSMAAVKQHFRALSYTAVRGRAPRACAEVLLTPAPQGTPMSQRAGRGPLRRGLSLGPSAMAPRT